jgi:hypothetical protein
MSTYRSGSAPGIEGIVGQDRCLPLTFAFGEGIRLGRPRWLTASVEPKSEHTQLDCGPDSTLPALRASSASFLKIFLPAMRPDSQAPVI